MSTTNYQRFAITIPEGMAVQIEAACKSEGRNRSEFFREAVRHYMGTHNGKRTPSSIMPLTDPARAISPFHPFAEWGSKGDAAYDGLGLVSAKDRELAQWAHLVETDPMFTDIRAVSNDVNNVAGEAIQ